MLPTEFRQIRKSQFALLGRSRIPEPAPPHTPPVPSRLDPKTAESLARKETYDSDSDLEASSADEDSDGDGMA